MHQNFQHNDCKKNFRRTPSYSNSMKVYSTILQGHEATKENAKEWAQGFGFSQDETEDFGYKFCHYIETVNGIDIHYNYGADYYFFSDNSEPVSTN